MCSEPLAIREESVCLVNPPPPPFFLFIFLLSFLCLFFFGTCPRTLVFLFLFFYFQPVSSRLGQINLLVGTMAKDSGGCFISRTLPRIPFHDRRFVEYPPPETDDIYRGVGKLIGRWWPSRINGNKQGRKENSQKRGGGGGDEVLVTGILVQVLYS